MSLVFVGFKSCLFFTGWLSMSLVIFFLLLHILGSHIKIYGSYFKSIYHSNLLIHRFYLVAHPFPTRALYTHGDTIPLVFSDPYDNISYISDYFQPHFKIWKVLHQVERKFHGLVHHFAAIQGTSCIEFLTLWEGV